MTIQIIREKKKKRKRRRGSSDKLALYVMAFLSVGLFLGFILAVLSIYFHYTGALICFTCVFAPIGTIAAIIPSLVVKKSMAENTGADGEGIKFAAAKAKNFNDDEGGSTNSPAI